MLLGRRAERAELESLFERARAGRSAALVLRGPAGVGKSALLEHAAATAAAGGLSVLRATGVEAESELPFAGLHQLLRPLVHRIDQLPVPQCRALRAALALEPGDGADRFVVSAAVLTLLADSAGQPGLLCLLDDAQWLDRPSLDVLLFVARRLDAEGIALVLAVRDGHLPPRVTANLAVLPVGPLDRSDAARLVADRAGVPVPDAVLTRLLHLTGGNALALAELTGLLAEDVLRGRAALPDPPPIGAGMEDAFLTRVRALPPDTQLLLLVAAAEGTGDIGTVLRAAAQLDVAERALDPAEADGLLQLTPDGLVFRHPLVRSAVYGGVSSSQRRSAHLALAEVLRHPTESDRRAWHRGAAALGPDDDVADALAASAERSRARSGYAGAAAALRRSAALTRDPQRRAGRLVASARDAWLGGEPDQAYASLGEADRHAVDPANRAAVAHLRAQFELRRGIAPDAYRMLLDGAVAAAHRAPGTALRMFAEASEAASYVGDVAGMVAAGRAAEDVPPVGAGEEFWRDQVVGVADLLEGRAAEGERRLRRLIERGPTLTEPQQLVLAGTASVYLGEIHVAFGFLERAAVAARVADMTGNLPYVLEFLAATEESRGRLAASQALSEEGLRLAEETGQDTSRCQHLANLAILAAWRGDAEECHRLAAATSELALARRLGFPAARAAWALAILDLGAGRYPAALARLQQLTQAGPGTGHPVVVFASTLDRVEAAVRAGEPAHARAALADVAAYTVTAGPWPRAVVACCRALLADDDAAGDAFEEALALHKEGRTPPPHRARTHLLYGEWLRRARRRVEAREHLRVAVEMFEQVGAPPWADRARVELRAAGAATGRRDVDTLTRLTPQELRIAQLAGDGQSTRDIAAQLFLSPRTVEYHLYKMFPKLGITSRTELVRLLAGASTADGTA